MDALPPHAHLKADGCGTGGTSEGGRGGRSRAVVKASRHDPSKSAFSGEAPRVWRKVQRTPCESPTTNLSFPDLQELLDMSETDPLVFPVPLPERPTSSPSISSRIRSRYRCRLQGWRGATALVSACNALYLGIDPHSAASCPTHSRTLQLEAAWARMHRYALSVCARAARRRREPVPTGVHAFAALLKLAAQGYSVFPLSATHCHSHQPR